MSFRYLVVWSGGYEAPSYEMFFTAEEAFTQAKSWEEDIQDGDWIDVLKLRVVGGLSVKQLDVKEA